MNFNIKKYLFALAIIVVSQISKAQDLNTHYSYQLNWFNINAAYTGETKGINSILNQRAQWVNGIDNNPVNTMVGLHTSVKDNMGVGGKIVYENRGLLSNLSAEFNYAYKIQLTETNKISFGMSIGIFQTYLDNNKLYNDKFTDLSDPLITSNYVNTLNMLTSFGALYKSKNLELGVSAPHLATSVSGLSDHLILMAKYNIKASDKIMLSPSLVAQNLTNSPNNLDLGLKIGFDSLVWIQGIYQISGNVVSAIGFSFNNFDFGYAYNASSKPLNVISNGSHDVFISFTFDKNQERRSEKERTKHLKTILTNLNNLNTNSNSSENNKEVNDLQVELNGLMDKMQNNQLSEEDEKRIDEIAKRINQLKQKQ